jgi:hypothetical protein
MRAIAFPSITTKQTVRNGPVRMIYFGPDDRFRIPILKHAGYSVDQCNSVCQLRAALSANPQTEAVAIAEDEIIDPRAAMFLTRTTSAALILFQSIDHCYGVSEFDFVVPILPSADQWLSGITVLVERRRSDRDRTHDRLPSAWQPVEGIYRLPRV